MDKGGIPHEFKTINQKVFYSKVREISDKRTEVAQLKSWIGHKELFQNPSRLSLTNTGKREEAGERIF